MSLKNRLTRSVLIASTALSMTAGAIEAPKAPENNTPTKVNQVAVAPSYLSQIKNGQKIVYNGLTVNIPLLRQKQETNKTLKNFDFVFEQDKAGLAFKENDKRYLILMAPEKLESLINAAVAKDMGTAPAQTIKPADPYKMTFRSTYPQFLIEQNGRRREMKADEISLTFDKALKTITECNSEGIIDVQAIAKKYAEKIGGVTGKTLSVSLNATPFKWSQNMLIEKLAESYKTDAVNTFCELPALRKEEEKSFNKTKQKQIALYEQKMEQIRQYQLQEQKREALRRQRLVHFKGRNFNPEITKKDMGNFSTTTLCFDEGDHYIELTNMEPLGKLTSSIQKLENGQYGSARELEAEEFKDLQTLLQQRLTAQQKQQLGISFFNRLSEKSGFTQNDRKDPKIASLILRRDRSGML